MRVHIFSVLLIMFLGGVETSRFVPSREKYMPTKFPIDNQEVCLVPDGCSCTNNFFRNKNLFSEQLCKTGEGCSVMGLNTICLPGYVTTGGTCQNEGGCMCDVTPSVGKKFEVQCDYGDICQTVGAHIICGGLLIDIEVKCTSDNCVCYNSKKGLAKHDSRCTQDMTCKLFEGEPLCVSGTVTPGNKCEGRICLCLAPADVKTASSRKLKEGEWCYLIDGDLVVAQSVIELDAVCSDKFCVCQADEGALMTSCERRQKCVRHPSKSALLCLSSTIKQGFICNSYKEDYCICEASPETIAKGVPKSVVVGNGLCVRHGKTLEAVPMSINSNTICQSLHSKCLCTSTVDEDKQVMCKGGEACAEFADGPRCVTRKSNAFKVCDQECLCYGYATDKTLTCKPGFMCTNFNERPGCFKTVIGDRDLCSDNDGCVCKDNVSQGWPKESNLCPINHVCAVGAGRAMYCLLKDAPVLTNGQYMHDREFWCSNQGQTDKGEAKLACPMKNFCISIDGVPSCHHQSLPHTYFCEQEEGCLCAPSQYSRNNAVFCKHKEQCLRRSGQDPVCMGANNILDSVCTEEKGCPCFANPRSTYDSYPETIMCKIDEYCGSTMSGPTCQPLMLTSETKTATTPDGVVCAMRVGKESKLESILCPIHYTCKYAGKTGLQCENTDKQIQIGEDQTCMNLRAGCKCVIKNEAVDCNAGHKCYLSKSHATCSPIDYKWFECPETQPCYCGSLSVRFKWATEYCWYGTPYTLTRSTPDMMGKGLTAKQMINWTKRFSQMSRPYKIFDPKTFKGKERRLAADQEMHELSKI